MVTLDELVDAFMERKYEALNVIDRDVLHKAHLARQARSDDSNAALIEAHVELACIAKTLIACEIESGRTDYGETWRETVSNAALVVLAAWHSLNGSDLGEQQNVLARWALVETINFVMAHAHTEDSINYKRELWGALPRARSREILARMGRIMEAVDA